MASDKELSSFLQNVERRAYKHAFFAVRREETALDIVQDAMLKLAEKYGNKPANELPMLFQRILQNAIHDHFRREKVRNSWVTAFSSLGAEENGGDDFDALEALAPQPGSQGSESTEDLVAREEIMANIEEELARLPPRQREAFLLRYWEDMDVSETAAVMGCSEGSVKTHCSRATHALALALQAKGIRL